jgi:hypothetical protein
MGKYGEVWGSMGKHGEAWGSRRKNERKGGSPPAELESELSRGQSP